MKLTAEGRKTAIDNAKRSINKITDDMSVTISQSIQDLEELESEIHGCLEGLKDDYKRETLDQ